MDFVTGWVLDAPVIVGFARVDQHAQAFVWAALEQNATLIIPAAALAVAHAHAQDAGDVINVLLGLPNVKLEPLDARRAADTGALLAAAEDIQQARADFEVWGTAQACAAATDHDWAVVTDGTARVNSLNPKVEVKLLWRAKPPKPDWT